MGAGARSPPPWRLGAAPRRWSLQREGLAFAALNEEQLAQKIRSETSNSPFFYYQGHLAAAAPGAPAYVEIGYRNPDPFFWRICVTIFFGLANLAPDITAATAGRDTRWPYVSDRPTYVGVGQTGIAKFNYTTPALDPSSAQHAAPAIARAQPVPRFDKLILRPLVVIDGDCPTVRCHASQHGTPGRRSTGGSVVSLSAAAQFAVAVLAGLATATTDSTSPTNVRVLDVTADVVTIAFTGSTDDIGLRWYTVSAGGRTQATTSPSHTEFGGLRSETTYSLTVSAVDLAGNVSAPSDPVTFTTDAWPEVPGLRVTSVTGGNVSLAWGTPPGMEPYRYLVYDGGQPEAVAKGQQILMKGLAAGTHAFTVRGFHVSGSQTPPGTAVTVTVAPRGNDQTVPTSPGSPTTREKEDEYEFVTTWTASTDPFDPSSSLTYDLLQTWAGALFTAKYGVVGTQYEGVDIRAVRAVDPAGNRSAPAFTTLVW